MVKSRDVSVSLSTKGDRSPEPTPHVADDSSGYNGDHDRRQLQRDRCQPHERFSPVLSHRGSSGGGGGGRIDDGDSSSLPHTQKDNVLLLQRLVDAPLPVATRAWNASSDNKAAIAAGELAGLISGTASVGGLPPQESPLITSSSEDTLGGAQMSTSKEVEGCRALNGGASVRSQQSLSPVCVSEVREALSPLQRQQRRERSHRLEPSLQNKGSTSVERGWAAHKDATVADSGVSSFYAVDDGSCEERRALVGAGHAAGQFTKQGPKRRRRPQGSDTTVSEHTNGYSEFVPSRVPNPFYFRIELSAVDKVKVFLMTIFVLPVRIFFVVLFMVLTWLGCFIGLLGYSEQELESKPIQGWRRTWWHPFFAGVMEQMFLWGGIIWEFKGKKASRSEAPILVCGPHHSLFDGLIVLLSGGQSPCAKVDSKFIPLLGTVLRFIQPVFVKRNSKESRQTTLTEIKNRATSKEPWQQIVIFPEGTCSNGTVFLKFKQGAFSAGVPVQPVLIRYPNHLNTLTWTWDGPSALKALWLTMCQWRTRMVVEYMPVYKPSEIERQDPVLFAENVRNLMARALGVGTTELSFDDLRYIDTGDPRQPQHTIAIVKVLKFRAKHRLALEELLLDIAKLEQLKLSLRGLNTSDGQRPVLASRAVILTTLGIASSTTTEAAREMFDALSMESEICPAKGADEHVDLRTLIAAFCLVNNDGVSAFHCLSDADAVDEVSHAEPSLCESGFCRLCWLAMQIPSHEASAIFESRRMTSGSDFSGITLSLFRQLLERYSDRCKGIIYFDPVRRLDVCQESENVNTKLSEDISDDVARDSSASYYISKPGEANDEFLKRGKQNRLQQKTD